jgi:hypothetical protein
VPDGSTPGTYHSSLYVTTVDSSESAALYGYGLLAGSIPDQIEIPLTVTVVPEPSTLGLLALGSLAFLRRWKRSMSIR